jgi:hypothetical protein
MATYISNGYLDKPWVIPWAVWLKVCAEPVQMAPDRRVDGPAALRTAVSAEIDLEVCVP